MTATAMSDMSWEPVDLFDSGPVPAVPAPVPSFREAVPTGSRFGSPFAPTGSLPPLQGGNRGPTGLSRTPRIRVHPCHAPILAGLDGDTCALPVMVDPYPLTPAGEVWALRAGRTTYHLLLGALDRRSQWSIPGHPPAADRPVLAAHRCSEPVPPEHRLPPVPAAPAPAKEMF